MIDDYWYRDCIYCDARAKRWSGKAFICEGPERHCFYEGMEALLEGD